jgi:hypothetical protein
VFLLKAKFSRGGSTLGVAEERYDYFDTHKKETPRGFGKNSRMACTVEEQVFASTPTSEAPQQYNGEMIRGENEKKNKELDLFLINQLE